MSESLEVWVWKAADPAKPQAVKFFEAQTYVEARGLAAVWFRIPETVVMVRALYEYEIAAMVAKKAQAA